MNETQVQTVRHVKSSESDIKNRRPQQHPGQDLEKMAIAFCGDALELANAGQHERDLTLAT